MAFGSACTDQQKADAQKIFELMRDGLSCRAACKQIGFAQSSFHALCHADADMGEQYARAREAGLDAMAEEILEISDDATNDWMERNGKDSPGWALNGENVQRSKLRVDARKWLLSKMAPKKYGERVEVDQTTKLSGSVSVSATLSPELQSMVDSVYSAAKGD